MANLSLFGRTGAIERRIDEFLDKVSEIGMVAEAAFHHYLEAGPDEILRERAEQAIELKRAGSALRREIETELYTEMLIPDLRGDVARLIGALHDLMELMEHGLRFARFERAEYPEEVRQDMRELISTGVRASEAAVVASRAFFRNVAAVRDHVHKVGFHESESDRIADRLLEKIFGSDLPLVNRLQLAEHVRGIDALADAAERIGDELTIYAIKRAE